VQAHFGATGWLEARKSFDLCWIREILANEERIISNIAKNSQQKQDDDTGARDTPNSARKRPRALSSSAEFVGNMLRTLANELLFLILTHLDPKDLCSVSRVSRFWNAFITSESLWVIILPRYLSEPKRKTKPWEGSDLVRAPQFIDSQTNNNNNNKTCETVRKKLEFKRTPDYVIPGLLEWYFGEDQLSKEFWKTSFQHCEDGIFEEMPWEDFATKLWLFIDKLKQREDGEGNYSINTISTDSNGSKKKKDELRTSKKWTIEQLEKPPAELLASKEAAAPLFEYRCLKALIMVYDKKTKLVGAGTVTIEDWCSVTAWFGPLSVGLLKRIRLAFQFPGFHGFVSAKKFKKHMEGFPVGTFAIRLSETCPGFFVLARVVKKAGTSGGGSGGGGSDGGSADTTVSEGRFEWQEGKGYHISGKFGAKTMNQFCRALRSKLKLQSIRGRFDGSGSYDELFKLT